MIERIPFEAQNALRGELSSFDALGKSTARLKSYDRGRRLGAKLEPSLDQLQTAAASVLQARPAVETIGAANQETRELAPKLLSELGDLASAVGVQKLEGMSRYLERFELTVQRIQQELNGLASGVSDAAPDGAASRGQSRIPESSGARASRARSPAWRCRGLRARMPSSA